MMWRLFRFRVCLWGWRYHRWWVSTCLDADEWRELYEDEPDPECAYLEGWCRDDA